jgi:glyoxylase-like metal-dependent hydrolase (beta-lactamase superfamily II)
MAPRFDRDFDVPYGVLEPVSPLVRRIVAENPGPFTFRGTGTYVVGHGTVAVIDPGPDTAAHLDALLDALRGETVSHVLVTHTHRDHSPGARLVAERTGARIVGCAPHPADDGGLVETPDEAEVTTEEPWDAAHAPHERMGDGDVVTGPGWTLDAVETPGHIANHLCFALREEATLFSGDHVMGWSTTVIAPPAGDVDAYLDSLDKVRRRPETCYRPTHGPAVTDPVRLVGELIEHRHDRDAQVLGAVRDGLGDVKALVAHLYADVDEKLHKAAGRSVLAHLLSQRRRGLVAAEGPLGIGATWRPVGGR